MRKAIHVITVAALIYVLALPLAFVLTFLLAPLWSWIEATYGIESIGHSGPADWCFYAVYGVLIAAGTLMLRRIFAPAPTDRGSAR